MNRVSTVELVVLTPPGRGAIASVLARGAEAIDVVSRRFHGSAGRSLADEPLGKILVGRWGDPQAGEEVVVCRRAVDRIEVHSHGGSAAVDAVVASLVELGCRQIDWRKAIGTSRSDQISAAAEIALTQAPTLRTAETLWDQRAGALFRALQSVASALNLGDTATAVGTVNELLARASVGLHLTTPWHVALAGEPNVGKSSLMNALCGYERAIVHATPGTTRDLVTTETAIDGWPVQLIDTAGLHDSHDPLEAAGMELARRRLAEANLVLVLVDASCGWVGDDESLTAAWPNALVVANKCDLVPDSMQLALPPGAILVSALERQGLAELERAIAERLVLRPPEAGAAVPFLEIHVTVLQKIALALAAGRVSEARQLLGEFGLFPAEC